MTDTAISPLRRRELAAWPLLPLASDAGPLDLSLRSACGLPASENLRRGGLMGVPGS